MYLVYKGQLIVFDQYKYFGRHFYDSTYTCITKLDSINALIHMPVILCKLYLNNMAAQKHAIIPIYQDYHDISSCSTQYDIISLYGNIYLNGEYLMFENQAPAERQAQILNNM